jgi:chemotaxis family two-component system response regulator Rcp1
MEKETQTFQILVVEPDQGHARLIEAGIQSDPAMRQIVTVGDGESAIAFLQQTRPHLIILNLDLPARKGREVLAEIKADPTLRRIPIVVLTDLADRQEIAQSYASHGNCYVIKTTDEMQLVQTIHKIETFWLGIVTLPLE